MENKRKQSKKVSTKAKTKTKRIVTRLLVTYLVSFIFILLMQGTYMLATLLTSGTVESVSMGFGTFFIMWTSLSLVVYMLDDHEWG